MSELSPAARELLAAARDQLGPDAATVARMRSGIAAAAAKSSAAGAGSTALATKLGLVTIVAGIAIGAAVFALRSSPSPRQTAAAPASTAPQELAHKPTEGAAAPRAHVAITAEPPAKAPAASEPREAIAVRHEVEAMPDIAEQEERPAREAEPASRSAAPLVDLAREVELIDRAMAALRAGDPRAAIAAVKLHATETRGRGQLAEDAAAIEIEAACRLHDPTVGAKLAAFDEHFPTSAQRSRLPTNCK